MDGQLYAEIIKKFSWFNKKFTLDIPGPNDYTITGSFWGHNFSFFRDNQEVATISKKAFAWRDSYSVEIHEDENHAEILITCIVIDQILHDGRNS